MICFHISTGCWTSKNHQNQIPDWGLPITSCSYTMVLLLGNKCSPSWCLRSSSFWNERNVTGGNWVLTSDLSLLHFLINLSWTGKLILALAPMDKKHCDLNHGDHDHGGLENSDLDHGDLLWIEAPSKASKAFCWVEIFVKNQRTCENHLMKVWSKTA